MWCRFDTEVATQVGASAAAIYEYIRYWCARNEKTGKNEHEGNYWMFCTAAELTERFPFMSEDQVRRSLDKLTEAGMIKKGCFNKRPFDRTAWYSIPQNRDIEVAKSRHRAREIASSELAKSRLPSGEIAGPIPYKETNRRISKTNSKETSTFENVLNSYAIVSEHPELRQTILDYMENRKALKSPIKTERALRLNINEALKLSGEEPEKMRLIFEQSIRNGWKGVFELKEEKRKTAKSAGNEFDRLLEEEGYL